MDISCIDKISEAVIKLVLIKGAPVGKKEFMSAYKEIKKL